MRPPRGKWLAAALLFAFSLLILFAASMQYYWPGKWWGSTGTLTWKGGALTLAKGRGYSDQGGLRVDGLAEPGLALATLSPAIFRAEDYPYIRLSMSCAKPVTNVEFMWYTVEKPDHVFSLQVPCDGVSVTVMQMSGDTNWSGQVKGLALRVRAPLDAPLVIAGVELGGPLGIVWREWFDAGPWAGDSINFADININRQWIAVLPFVAAALGLALLGYGVLVWRKILFLDIRMLWALVFLAWFTLDMRWQLDLWHKLSLTQQRYAGKSWEEKHLAAEDGALFDLMQQVRAKLPSTQSRIFIFADDPYLLIRGAYHLYPFNVMSAHDLLPEGQFKPGDFIVILGKDEVEFDPAQHLLKWGAGQQLGADLLLLAKNNVLLRAR